MESQTGFAIAAIIASILGPLAGVVAAHLLSKQQKKAETAIDLFGKIARDTQQFVSGLTTHSRLLRDPSPESRGLLAEYMQHVFAAVAELEADRILVGLLFGSRADKMKRDLQSLMDLVPELTRIEKSSVSTSAGTTPTQEHQLASWRQQMEDLFLAITHEMKPLYCSLSDVVE